MAIIVGHNGPSRYATTIINRTQMSGGSIGGNKKPGTWGGNVYMAVRNVGQHYKYRIPQQPLPMMAFMNTTTLRPLQYRRGSYALTHSGTLLG